ncbi:hypothetical protein LX32DRAFT_636998 [Colletotrichum zoysiae]|uniref:Uncharacterized protein n=1 Tax=Colletotrichum zoysiae TaxID=1216348 RepID=A0AAD9HMT1_9PEZI|nr:hypothetical protein LX32DRAFT_636998 [Colletotrichum zoysiae]
MWRHHSVPQATQLPFARQRLPVAISLPVAGYLVSLAAVAAPSRCPLLISRAPLSTIAHIAIRMPGQGLILTTHPTV